MCCNAFLDFRDVLAYVMLGGGGGGGQRGVARVVSIQKPPAHENQIFQINLMVKIW
jgi:hypothetical protein